MKKIVVLTLVLLTLIALVPVTPAAAQSPRTTHRVQYGGYHHRRRNTGAFFHRTGHHIRSGGNRMARTTHRVGHSIKQVVTGHN